MWSDSYRDYVKALVLTNRDEYPYYVAHTCSYFGSVSSYNYPSFKVYFSKKPITASSLYSYVLQDDSVVYSVIGSSANNNAHAQRVTVNNIGGTINIDTYEFVYSNAEYSSESIQPDITVSEGVNQVEFQAVSLVLLCFLLAVLVVKLLKRS